MQIQLPKQTLHPNFTILAVDFDGVLCENRFPEIGPLNSKLIQELKDLQKQGNKVILWTNRVNNLIWKEQQKPRNFLSEALSALKSQNFIPDAINENIPEILEYLNNDHPSPKVSADVYLDDHAQYYEYKRR